MVGSWVDIVTGSQLLDVVKPTENSLTNKLEKQSRCAAIEREDERYRKKINSKIKYEVERT